LGGLTIQRPNPVANAQSASTAQNSPKGITLTGSGGTPLAYAITTAPRYGTLTGSGATRIYTPNPGYYGEDSFYFTTSWGCQTSAPARVSIVVTAGTVAATGTVGGAPSPARTVARDGRAPGTGEPVTAVLYPNPVAQTLYVGLNRSVDHVRLTIVDAKGDVVCTKQYGSAQTNRLEVPADALRPGLYVLHLQTEWGVQTLKFVKM
jgi:hypothetical protein